MNTRRSFLTAVLPVVLLLCLRSGAFAQNAQLTGIISDDNSALIAGVQITLTNVNTSMTRRVVTNADGYYSIPFVPPGNYQVNVVANGFKPVTRNNLSINVDQAARIDFTLEPGTITESVNITWIEPPLERETSSIGQVIESLKRCTWNCAASSSILPTQHTSPDPMSHLAHFSSDASQRQLRRIDRCN